MLKYNYNEVLKQYNMTDTLHVSAPAVPSRVHQSLQLLKVYKNKKDV
jgi:hypothetical protein